MTRLENAAGAGQKPFSVLIVNEGETEESAWTRTHGNSQYPSASEIEERFSMFIVINLN